MVQGFGRSRLLAELQEELRRHGSDVVRGQVVGLTSDAPAPLRSDAGELMDAERAGVLAGRLYDRLLEDRDTLDAELVTVAGIYAASLAQAAVVGSFDEPSVDVMLKEHTAACIRIGWKGAQLEPPDELAFVHWLADELGLPLTEQTLARQARIRKRLTES